MHKGIVKTFMMASLVFYLYINALGTAFAHDSSYGYSKWNVEENRIKGTLVIDELSIMELGSMDENGDGILSAAELNTFYPVYIRPYLLERLIVNADGEPLSFSLSGDIRKTNSNEVQMELLFHSKWQIHSAQIEYKLFYEKSNNKHKNLAFIYLPGNPDHAVEHIFQIQSPVWEGKAADPVPFWNNFGQFILLGVEHILVGYDHILFLLALIAVGLSLRESVKVITAFTVAHSIALIAATMEWMVFNARFIESAIAFSICYVAIENIWSKRVRYRSLIAFVFGFIHGFGFANVLSDISMSKSNLISSLLSFNIGVELGQLMLIAVLLPLIFVLKKTKAFRTMTVSISVAVFGLGAVWLIERVMDVSILGF